MWHISHLHLIQLCWGCYIPEVWTRQAQAWTMPKAGGSSRIWTGYGPKPPHFIHSVSAATCCLELSIVPLFPPNSDPAELLSWKPCLHKEGCNSRVFFMPKDFLVLQFSPVPDSFAPVAVLTCVKRAITVRCLGVFAPLMTIYHRSLQPTHNLANIPLSGSRIPPELHSSIIHLISWGNLLIKH